jgi:hypothetical protein
VPFPQLFAKGKSLKSEGIGMLRDKNKGLHGLLGRNLAMPNQNTVKQKFHVQAIFASVPCSRKYYVTNFNDFSQQLKENFQRGQIGVQ